MSKAISPDQVAQQKSKQFPDAVFDAFNELIAKNFSSGSATVRQDEVTQLICAKLGITSQAAFDAGYLNVEEVYKEAGWKVSYDRPGYNESYPATFAFSIKK